MSLGSMLDVFRFWEPGKHHEKHQDSSARRVFAAVSVENFVRAVTPAVCRSLIANAANVLFVSYGQDFAEALYKDTIFL